MPEIHPLAGRLAAPSCVLPAAVAKNVQFLNGKVDEVALCLFETDGCLAYTETDLPLELAQLPLRFHVHLPVDLPWPARSSSSNPKAVYSVADMALAVCAKAAYLQPQLAVLHPPEGGTDRKRRLLEQFTHRWHAGTDTPLLLENVAHCDIAELGQQFLCSQNVGLCLDTGHLLGYRQKRLLHSELPESAVLVHWSAPGKADEHLPLTSLTASGYAISVDIMGRLPNTATHLAEIFCWSGVAASLPVLAAMTRQRGINHAQV